MTSPSNLAHPTDDVLEQHSLGRLPESEAEIVEEHLLFCQSCQVRLAAADEFAIAARLAAQELLNAPADEPWWKRFFAIPTPVLAAAACAVLALAVYLPRRNAPEAVVDLYAMRGQESSAQVPAGSNLTLRLSLDGVSGKDILRAELADTGGVIAGKTNVDRTEGIGVAHFSGQKPGAYWVRLYSGDSLLREYSITVR